MSSHMQKPIFQNAFPSAFAAGIRLFLPGLMVVLGSFLSADLARAQGDSGREVFDKAQRKMDLGLLKDAAELLGLHAAPKGTSVEYHQQAALLAEVYCRSHQYEKAMRTARESGEILVQNRSKFPEIEFDRLRRGYVLVFARACLDADSSFATGVRSERGVKNRRLAILMLSECIQLDTKTKSSDVQLELLVLRARLAEGLPETGAQPAGSGAWWSEAEQYAKTLDPSRGTTELRVRVALFHATCLAALKKHQQAAEQLQVLASRLDKDHPLQQDLWKGIADHFHLAGKSEEELDAWRKLVAWDGAQREKTAPEDRTGTINGYLVEAEHRRCLARAMQKQGMAEATRKQWQESLALDRRVCTLLDQAERDGCDADEARAMRIAAFQGIVEAGWNGRDPHGKPETAARDNDILNDACRLRDLWSEVLLPDDPRIGSLNVDLAAEYIRIGDIDEASRFLNDARKFFPSPRIADPSTQVRFFMLDCEMNRSKGRMQDAQTSLDEANRVYRSNRIDDETLRLTLDLNQARLHQATGRYGQAERELDELARRAKEAGPAMEEVFCLASLSKALLCKSLSRFSEAEKLCNVVLQRRREFLGSETRELLPYYVAIAAIQIDAGKLEDAKPMVDQASAVCTRYHLKDTLSELQVRHQRALIHFGYYQAAHRPEDARIAAATWEELLKLQTERGWQVERIYSLYSLSRLKFLQWEHASRQYYQEEHGKKLDQYRRLQTAYERDVAVFQEKLTTHREERSKYEQARTAYESKHRDPAVDQEKRYRDLSERYAKLKKAETGLQEFRDRLDNKQKEVRAAYNACVSESRSSIKRSAGTILSPSRNDSLLLDADSLSAQAVRLAVELRIYPNLQYLTLCNRAAILRAQSGTKAGSAISSLIEAVALLERPRMVISSNDATRAGFLARYATAFDLLVAWSVEDRQPDAALRYAELCRNRSFLDHISIDGVRFADNLAEKDRFLAKHEEELLAQYAAISAKLAATSETDPAAPAVNREARKAAFQASLDDICRQFTENRRHIRQMSPVYQNTLVKPLAKEEVQTAISQFLESGELGLYYYLGAGGSFAFLLGAEPGTIEVFPLKLPSLDITVDRNVLPSHARHWVEKYRAAIRSKSVTRPENKQMRAELVNITKVLMPKELLIRLRGLQQSGHSHLVIFPDGSLYDFPFEALLMESDTQARFLMDELGSLSFSYAPSIMIDRAFKNRPREVTEGMAGQVLSLGRPDFSRLNSNGGPPARYYLRDISGVDSAEDLPESEEESNAVIQALSANVATGPPRMHATQLLGKNATEANLRKEIDRTRPTFLHIATHGIATDNTAALLMALPDEPRIDPCNDGFLELREIYDLPLSRCELAVVSACNGNVGGEIPLEMGATLSRAFLSAGARRVVSSQWPVSDKATAELMKRFFEEIAVSIQNRQPADYAMALRNARNHVRQCQEGRWSEPFYWAPFILLGPSQAPPMQEKEKIIKKFRQAK